MKVTETDNKKNPLTIFDQKGRILVRAKSKSSGVSYTFARYPDMTEADKKASETVFGLLQENEESLVGPDGVEVNNIRDFLNFKDQEQDLCG